METVIAEKTVNASVEMGISVKIVPLPGARIIVMITAFVRNPNACVRKDLWANNVSSNLVRTLVMPMESAKQENASVMKLLLEQIVAKGCACETVLAMEYVKIQGSANACQVSKEKIVVFPLAKMIVTKTGSASMENATVTMDMLDRLVRTKFVKMIAIKRGFASEASVTAI